MIELSIDIDHFRQVNDTHGHRVGDMILRGLSERLVELVRTIDRVCRYGGEEITVRQGTQHKTRRSGLRAVILSPIRCCDLIELN